MVVVLVWLLTHLDLIPHGAGGAVVGRGRQHDGAVVISDQHHAVVLDGRGLGVGRRPQRVAPPVGHVATLAGGRACTLAQQRVEEGGVLRGRQVGASRAEEDLALVLVDALDAASHRVALSEEPLGGVGDEVVGHVGLGHQRRLPAQEAHEQPELLHAAHAAHHHRAHRQVPQARHLEVLGGRALLLLLLVVVVLDQPVPQQQRLEREQGQVRALLHLQHHRALHAIALGHAREEGGRERGVVPEVVLVEQGRGAAAVQLHRHERVRAPLHHPAHALARHQLGRGGRLDGVGCVADIEVEREAGRRGQRVAAGHAALDKLAGPEGGGWVLHALRLEAGDRHQPVHVGVEGDDDAEVRHLGHEAHARLAGLGVGVGGEWRQRVLDHALLQRHVQLAPPGVHLQHPRRHHLHEDSRSHRTTAARGAEGRDRVRRTRPASYDKQRTVLSASTITCRSELKSPTNPTRCHG